MPSAKRHTVRPPRMLSGRLKEIEAAGLVERVVIPETPVRVEYRLT